MSMSMKSITPGAPLLYGKGGVCGVCLVFLNFDQKHRLWVRVKTASRVQFVRRGGSNVYSSMF